MSELTPTQAEELRRELAEVRTHCDLIEHRLDARVIAVENRLDGELAELRNDIRQLHLKIGAMESRFVDLEYLVKANHMAQIHLWGVTARFMKLAERQVVAAQHKAEKMLAPRKRRRS